jgi:hypothetical protein
LFTAISFIKVIVSGESFGFLACPIDVRLQNTQKSSRWKPQKRLWLDKEERLFPGSGHPGQKRQENSISFPGYRSFELATKDDQLVS